ncbi:MAG: zinc-ribbon domain-containing protein [Clostridia bacterium]|nr:zinc-ribbon domain-containing protein [Clostridia bacterium]MDY4083488.1 zinc-ribbon domain-containing protein [Eubacteriales bacterium]
MFCSKCGKEISDDAVICPNCGVPTNNYNGVSTKPKSNTDDAGNVNTMSIIALVMSFIVPLVGFIMGLIYRPKAVAIDDESSRKKCTAAIWISVVYFALCIVLSIVYSIVVAGIIAGY